MSAVTNLIAARKPGDRASLQALGIALASALRDTPDRPTDPVELYDGVETDGYEQPGTWQEVRAARDFGDLSDAEYQYLAAAVEALTQEDA